jgi:hypothetical protein
MLKRINLVKNIRQALMGGAVCFSNVTKVWREPDIKYHIMMWCYGLETFGVFSNIVSIANSASLRHYLPNEALASKYSYLRENLKSKQWQQQKLQ